MDWYWWLLILLIVAILIWRLLRQAPPETPAPRRNDGGSGTAAQAGTASASGAPTSDSTGAEEFIAPSGSSFESRAAADDIRPSMGDSSTVESAPPSPAGEHTGAAAQMPAPEEGSLFDEEVPVESSTQVESEPESPPERPLDAEAPLEPAGSEAIPEDSGLAEPSAPEPESEAVQGYAAATPAGPHGPGSAAPGAGGSGPVGWMIKGSEGSKLYYTQDSPNYGQTQAEVWFQDEESARAAGFRRWDQQG